tara:strand:- start:556 stop:1461 length:906 start_codon:yes stop_codon:yes gene_type:complete
MEWYSRKEVAIAMWNRLRDHEVKWLVDDPEMGEFGIRNTRVSRQDDVLTWLKILDAHKRPVGVYLGTNIVDWNQIKLPPRLREGENWNKEAREDYRQLWKQYHDPEFLGKEKFLQTWKGKIMVWDIDDENLSQAFMIALKIYNELSSRGFNPEMIFSGGKGFHIILGCEEAAELSGVTLRDFIHERNPLKTLGKHYREAVQSVATIATGEPLYRYDMAPTHRMGLIRCPYSLHQKTGLPVWPLSSEEISALQDNLEDGKTYAPLDIAQILFSWTTTDWWDQEVPTSPMSEIWKRHKWLFGK